MANTESRALKVFPTPPSTGPGAGVYPAVLPTVTPETGTGGRDNPRAQELLAVMRDNVRSGGQYGQTLVDSGIFAVSEAGHGQAKGALLRRSFGLAKAELVQRNKTERHKLRLAQQEAQTTLGKTQQAADLKEIENTRQGQTKLLIFGGIALVLVVILLRR